MISTHIFPNPSPKHKWWQYKKWIKTQEISIPPLKLNRTQSSIYLTIFPSSLSKHGSIFWTNLIYPVYEWGFNAAFNLLQIWYLIPLSTVKDAYGCILVKYLLGPRWRSDLSQCISGAYLYCEYSTPIIHQLNKSRQSHYCRFITYELKIF